MADNGTLGKYELRREIGRGAMGVVFEAYDPMIKRVVALKTIRSDQLGKKCFSVSFSRSNCSRSTRSVTSPLAETTTVFFTG